MKIELTIFPSIFLQEKIAHRIYKNGIKRISLKTFFKVNKKQIKQINFYYNFKLSKIKFLYLICIIIMVKLQIIYRYFNKLNYFFESKICKHMENRYLKAFLILLNQ